MAVTRPDICRIKKRRDFLNAASKGNKVVASTLVLQGCAPLGWSDTPSSDECDIAPDALRVGFTVTKRTGNAVVRNRIRRRLKAAVDEVMPEMGRAGWDYVLIGRARALDEPYAIILRDLRYALRKVVKLEREKTA